MERLLQEICDGVELRENLIELKTVIKAPEAKERFVRLVEGKERMFVDFLESEDPKVRRATAKILGELGLQEAMNRIFEVYLKEETLFVKKDYLSAIEQLDYDEILPQLKIRYEELLKENVDETLQVHLANEMQQIQKMVVAKEGIKKHQFTGIKRTCEVLLVSRREFRENTLNEIHNCPKKLVPTGVMLKTSSIDKIENIRTYEEVLFLITPATQYPNQPEVIGEMIGKTDLLEFLKECHDGEAPFYFRVQVNGKMDVEQRSIFTKKLARRLEQATEGQLINSTSGYEVEIRLLEGREGTWSAFVKLYTMTDGRFKYRKEVVSTSMKPYFAANLVALAKPYLKEGAQILDPYCGVGTMLIERRMQVPAGDTYGIDIFGEAIDKARINSELVGPNIHYINRDFKDFTHAYLFDEIITDMPTKSKNLTHKQVDELYKLLFVNGENILKPGSMLIIRGNERGTMRKCLRIFSKYRLVREFCLDKKAGDWLFIIEYVGE